MVSERKLNKAKIANKPKPAAIVNSTLDNMDKTPKVKTLNIVGKKYRNCR